ncbi:cupin domain-containing protein [Rhodovibrionaceae bacterium A322]
MTENTDPDFDLGGRLRELREMHNLSQRELAKRASVSNAVISLMERNETSPSVGMLKKVLDGIPISMSDFFALEQPKEQVFFEASELVEIASGNISYRQVGRDLRGKAIQLLHECYQPGADTGEALLRHEAEEGGVIISGELELTVGGQRRVLKAGDSYYFDSRTPHRFRNLGKEEAVVVSACSPPSF